MPVFRSLFGRCRYVDERHSSESGQYVFEFVQDRPKLYGNEDWVSGVTCLGGYEESEEGVRVHW